MPPDFVTILLFFVAVCAAGGAIYYTIKYGQGGPVPAWAVKALGGLALALAVFGIGRASKKKPVVVQKPHVVPAPQVVKAAEQVVDESFEKEKKATAGAKTDPDDGPSLAGLADSDALKRKKRPGL